MCPSLPPSKRRSWQPTPVKREYQPHAVRSSLYDTTTWRKLRIAHLRREPLCRACDKQGCITPATVVDHVRPVNEGGDFWAIENHQSLCASCHARKSQSERYKTKKP